MKGAIVDKGNSGIIQFKSIFEKMKEFQKEYNWLISDCEAYPIYDDIKNKLYQYGEYTWLTGEELTDIINRDDIAWSWAVLSGFEKTITMDEVLEYELPYADGYVGFWNENISIQNPLATIELVAWDGLLTLFISKDDALVEEFRKAVPLSLDLQQYNIS